MQLFAKKMNGKTVAFEVLKSDRIIDLKYKIQEKLGLHPDEQKWVYQGLPLEDNKTIDECGICEKSVINVVARLRYGMQIFAKPMDGRTVAFEVLKSDRIIDIKRKVQEKIGLLPNEQKLVYQGGILEDNKTIDEYGICEKSVINVVERLRGGLQIFAKTMDGKTVAFEVQITERISDIKKKIQEKIGLSPDEQILIYKGGLLNDDGRTVNDYQITEKSIIDVIAILRRNEIQIFIKTSDKSIIPINIVNTSRIIDVKSIIKEKTGSQLAGNNNLIYKTNILNDYKLLIDYQIEDGSVISISGAENMFVYSLID